MKLILRCRECRIVLVELSPGAMRWMPLVGEIEGNAPLKFDPDSASRCRLAYSVLRHHLICEKDEYTAREHTESILYAAFKDGFVSGVENARRDLVSNLSDPSRARS